MDFNHCNCTKPKYQSTPTSGSLKGLIHKQSSAYLDTTMPLITSWDLISSQLIKRIRNITMIKKYKNEANLFCEDQKYFTINSMSKY